MDAANPFAQPPATPDPIIAQVRRQVLADAGPVDALFGDSVDRVVDSVVRNLWGSRVKTFVPILALRESRELLRQEAVTALAPSSAAPAATVTTVEGRSGRSVPDVLVVADARPLDWRDSLAVADDDVLRL